jgi:hypothetical protein
MRPTMKKSLLLLMAASGLLLAGCTVTSTSYEATATRWEYREANRLEEVNSLAREGWIVVNLAIPESGPYVYLLKRAKP